MGKFMQLYQVKLHGNVIKTFFTKQEARDFLVNFLEYQLLATQSLDLIDEAVLKSDMVESKQVIQHIMELR